MSRSHFILLASALSLAACEPGEIRLVGPEDSSGSRTEFDVLVTLEDSALAEALGWEGGVPEVHAEWAFVHHWRYRFHDVASDSSGVIRFEREGRGWHWIAAEREVEVDGVRRILGGGAKTTGSAGLSLRVDDPGTLVISEIYMIGPPVWETGNVDYLGSEYIELYNNGSEVLYLDGVLLGIAYSFWNDTTSRGHHPCSHTETFREDPNAVWSEAHWRFPGSGTDHPIVPGEAVVVAVNAANHTGVHASMLDLSGAGFEFGLSGTADNPAAANMEYVGPPSGRVRTAFYIPKAFWFVASPLDVEALIVMEDQVSPVSFVEYRGFPRESILDVAVIWWDATSNPVIPRDSPPCEHPIHPRFDQLPGGYVDGERPEDLLVSPQRRVVRTEGGRRILLDTNTSAVDFKNVARTPGWIP